MSETPHLTHLTLTDEEFRILNSLFMIGLATSRGAHPGSLLVLAMHMQQLVHDVGWETIFEFVHKLDALGAANPNFDSQPLSM